MSVDYLQRIRVEFDKSNKKKVIDLFMEQFGLIEENKDDDFLRIGKNYLSFEIMNTDLHQNSDFILELEFVSKSVSFLEYAFCQDSSFYWEENEDKDEDED